MDLFYSCEGHLLPFNSFCNKFNVKCNLLQDYSILSSILQNWKKVLQEGSKDPVNIFTSYHSKPREKLNRWCSNTKSFTELYQRIVCYTKWKNEKSFLALLSFCPSECQTLWYLSINCMHASSFWIRFQEWYSISSKTKLLLSELEVTFGIIRCHT